MTNLIPKKQAEIAEIVDDALALTPACHKESLKEEFAYLAFCYVQDRDDGHMADIKKLLDTAIAGNDKALVIMQSQIRGEINQLRGDMRLGFQKITEYLGAIHTRLEGVEARIERLENARQLQYIDNRSYSYSDNRKYSRKGEQFTPTVSLMLMLAFLALAATMLAIQTRNVADIWQQMHTQGEVRSD